MRKILRKTISKYRVRCPYCDCEFEYDQDDIFYGNVIGGAAVVCPDCHNTLSHKNSLQSNIITSNIITERL